MLHAAARHSYSNQSTALRPGLRHTRLKAAVVGALASMSNYTPARPPIVVKPTAPHNSTVIWLHGLGDTGAGWADAASSFAAALPGTKFVFPTAAVRPVTLNGALLSPAPPGHLAPQADTVPAVASLLSYRWHGYDQLVRHQLSERH